MDGQAKPHIELRVCNLKNVANSAFDFSPLLPFSVYSMNVIEAAFLSLAPPHVLFFFMLFLLFSVFLSFYKLVTR